MAVRLLGEPHGQVWVVPSSAKTSGEVAVRREEARMQVKDIEKAASSFRERGFAVLSDVLSEKELNEVRTRALRPYTEAAMTGT